MSAPIQTDWIDEEMKHLGLGDRRLEARACKIIGDLSQNPTASIPQFCDDWTATQAAYKFFSNTAVQRERVLAAQRQATIEYYTVRWLIERFHFVLKSGCAVEKRQLQAVPRLERFLGLANVVAWRLLWQTYVARVDPGVSCRVALADHEWKALYTFIHKTAVVPKQPPSLHQATRWIAQLGGFLGRKSDGQPGVKVLWRGWQRLYDITQTWLIFNTS